MADRRRPRAAVAITVSFVSLTVALLASVLLGSTSMHVGRAIHGLSPDYEILVNLRIPRAWLALWTGGALALSGVLFQALLRNALATPYTLGVAEGASLGAVLAIAFGWEIRAGFSAVSLSACIGAALVLVLIVAIASYRGRISSVGLLLAGVTVNSMCGAAILFLYNLIGLLKSFAIAHWLMGGLESPEYSTLLYITAILTPVCILIIWLAPDWNVLAVGERWATTRGLSTGRLLLIGSAAGAVLTGVVTALSGPIGFVGLIVPHMLRLWVGADHRTLAPCSFLMGAGFLALCDLGSRTILAPVEIPVGVITALIGGPFFIWILRSRAAGFAL